MGPGVVSVTILAGAVAVAGCESGCPQALVNDAVKFIDAHQSCRTDDDCVTFSNQCGEIPGGSCGTLVMNREGKESAEWRAIEKELADCAPDSCEICGLAVIPACTSGSCVPPRE